jgi:hypothetical protein
MDSQLGIVALLAALLFALQRAGAGAQELEPRAYTNTPVGLNFLIAGYAYQDGDVATDPGLPLEDAKIHLHTAVLAYARAFSLLGASAKVDVIVPYTWLSGSALVRDVHEERVVDGFNDPRFRLSVNFYGAPAITVAELPDYQQDLLIGASFQFAPPLGQYDEERAVNIGTNRWAFKPEVGVSQPFGNWFAEASAGVWFFTDNDAFQGNHRRSQEPLAVYQLHAGYTFRPGLWVAGDYGYYVGGRTAVDGVENDDAQRNSRVGLALSLPLSGGWSTKLAWSKGTTVRVGGDFTTLSLTLQYRWFD